MKTVRSIIAVFTFFICAAMAAQEVKPTFTEEGDLIKGVFYYEDGTVSQEGTYKNGKLHGEWISYNHNGEKTAIARYTDGNKTGKWFFWQGDVLTEVDYENNRLATVNKYKSTGALVTRD